MDELNRKQMEFQLSNALVDIISRYVTYDGQVEKFASEQATKLSKQFEAFIETDLLSRSD